MRRFLNHLRTFLAAHAYKHSVDILRQHGERNARFLAYVAVCSTDPTMRAQAAQLLDEWDFADTYTAPERHS